MCRRLSVIPGFIIMALLLFSEAKSQSVEELMSSGNGLLSNGAYTEAITVFKKVVSREPRNFEAQSNLAFAYLQSERYTNAVTEYTKAIALSRNTATCWLNLGFAYEKLGKRAKAIESINHAIELDPSNTDARMNLGAFLEDEKLYDKAIAQFEAVIKIDGANKGEAYTAVSRCLLVKGNVAGAKKYLNDALATNSNNADAHWQMGNIYWKNENKPEEALKEYKTATILEPNTVEFYDNYALLLESLKRKDEAIAVWKSAMIYTNDALKKEELENRISKLEKGESLAPPTKEERKAARENSDKQDKANMEKLQREMRADKGTGPGAKRIDAPPPDVLGDIDDVSKNKGAEDFDLRKAAKKKAADKGQ